MRSKAYFSAGSSLVMLLISTLFALNSDAQEGGLAWRTSTGARLFAVDEQTNVHASVNGSVIVLSPSGVPLRTNAICPLPGIARRDRAGNYYFAGSFDGTNDFGGTNVVGGWINNGRWYPDWPTCFLAKYSGQGALQWVVSFGVQATPNRISDILIDADGTAYVAYWTPLSSWMASFDNAGVKRWERNVGATTLVKIDTSIWYLFYNVTYGQISHGRGDLNGNLEPLGVFPPLLFNSQSTNGIPVVDGSNQFYEAGKNFNTIDQYVLRKIGADNSLVWDRQILPDAQWIVGQDSQNKIYLSGPQGTLAQYDLEANLISSNNFGSPCYAMIIDRSGNRFVSFADGSIGLLNSVAPYRVYVVETCANATNAVWTPVQTNKLVPGGDSSQKRFYRLRVY